MHGPTFMGNPLAGAVANASIDLLLEGRWPADVARVEAGLREGLAAARECPACATCGCSGAIGVVQLDDEVDMAAATARRLSARRVAAPVPRPRLHDAALRRPATRTWRGSRTPSWPPPGRRAGCPRDRHRARVAARRPGELRDRDLLRVLT